MADLKLAAHERTEFGKGAARRLRREGQIPAVLYGQGEEPFHLALPAQETFLALRNSNALIEINIEGRDKPVLGIPKQVQRDPLTGFLKHVDLLLVLAGQKVTVDVVLHFTGEAARDGMVNTDLNQLTVEAPVVSIPESIEVSIEGMEVGDAISVGDLKLPEGVTTSVDPEQLVVNVVPPPVVELETETDETEGAEPELVGDEDGDASEDDEAGE